MRNILKVASLLAFSLFISCSEEESGRDLGQNGFSHNETFYVLNNAFVTDEDILDSLPAGISVTLSNVNLADSSAVSNVSKLYFKYSDINLTAGTIATISDYYIEVGGKFEFNALDSTYVYTNGTYLLNSSQSGLTATEKNVTINSVTENNVDMTFSFTRTDGQIFSGKYSGIFSDSNVNP
ncbi:hypothetical protein [Flavobacterium macacae]|uniref:Uncharacterized protein n=1 Tax=Flavobacterium macacae TaxID=2488993 RepID=A0A3P3W8N5_9FLAO|nr:hypothetical protein [Flavobacterium macacae]RRJ90707.1 hypothetical protein EG849_09525 [Flavobacterium macacae]